MSSARKKRYGLELKHTVTNLYLKGYKSVSELSKEYKIPEQTIYSWAKTANNQRKQEQVLASIEEKLNLSDEEIFKLGAEGIMHVLRHERAKRIEAEAKCEKLEQRYIHQMEQDKLDKDILKKALVLLGAQTKN